MSAATAIETDEIAGQMREMGQRARAALHDLGSAGTERKNTALRGAAMALRDNIGDLLSSNEKDVTAAEKPPAVSIGRDSDTGETVWKIEEDTLNAQLAAEQVAAQDGAAEGDEAKQDNALVQTAADDENIES